MKLQTALSALRRKLNFRFVLLASLATLFGLAIISGAAQSMKDEREIEERIPAHLPIKVKVKNADKVKDRKNEKWLGDLEVEVTNTGSKPIYYLYIALSLPDVLTEDGKNIGYIIRYGRPRLVDLTEPLQPDDVAIPPGETVVLRVPNDRVRAWESLRAKGKLSNPKKLRFLFQTLNFGDGTGYWTPEGLPLPRKGNSSNAPCQEDNKSNTASTSSPPTGYSSNFLAATFFTQPVTLVPAIFLSSASTESSPTGDLCCPGTPSNCSYLRQNSAICICGEVEIAESAPCSDPYGGCSTTTEEIDPCLDSTGFEHYCHHHVIAGSCCTPTPTPSPSPSPSPAPTPSECDPATKPHDHCQCDQEAGGVWQCCDLNLDASESWV